MKLSVLSHLPLSADQGWPEIERAHPRLLKLFAFIVLPLSLLPPAMLYYAGNHYPEAFLPQAAGKHWGLVAAAFFLTELVTLLAMGWLIRQVAQTEGLRIDYLDAYLLAGIAPIPLGSRPSDCSCPAWASTRCCRWRHWACPAASSITASRACATPART